MSLSTPSSSLLPNSPVSSQSLHPIPFRRSSQPPSAIPNQSSRLHATARPHKGYIEPIRHVRALLHSSLPEVGPSSPATPGRTRHHARRTPSRIRRPPRRLGEEWDVDRVLIGDGSRNPDRRVLEDGEVYGACGHQIGASGFHEVDASTVPVLQTSATRVEFHVKAVSATAMGRDHPNPPTVDIRSLAAHCPRFLHGKVMSWCSDNRGFAVSVSRPSGERPLFTRLVPFADRRSGMIFEHENIGLCMSSTLLNVVWRLCGRERALYLRNKLRDNLPFFRKLGEMYTVVHKYHMKLDLRVDNSYTTFDGLSSVLDGVFLARLQCSGRYCIRRFDHTVVIDGNRHQILDSAERYPLRLTGESLFIYAGNEPLYFKIVDVREILPSGKH